jgi:putative protease
MFNARQRASNFSVHNLDAILFEAKKYHAKIFVTVNTLVKNEELFDVVRLLHQLERRRVDAVIVQDWGVFYLLKNYFPTLKIHASTQMTVHNSIAVAFCAKIGFDRVILARELTLSEVKKITSQAKIGVEVFIHGALCYSVSGCCLFSSYLSRNSANRGLCVQPCRRFYFQDDKTAPFFSLKDNQQVERIQQLAAAGVTSFKVEGRLKSADYVYCVGKSYRDLIDGKISETEAIKALQKDFGREKSSYFLGGNVSDTLTDHAGAGFYIGRVLKAELHRAALVVNAPVKLKNRLLLTSAAQNRQEVVKVEAMQQTDEYLWIDTPFEVQEQTSVFLLSENITHFPNRFPNIESPFIPPLATQKTEKMLAGMIPWQEKHNKEQYFIRINSLNWLSQLNTGDYDGVILKFDSGNNLASSLTQLQHFQNDIQYIRLELPLFIGEKELDFYIDQCRRYFQAGVQHFVLAHFSQRMLLPEGATFSVNENCYVLNDAAAAFFTRQQAACWIYPLENDLKNLLQGKDRNGMINMYFCPTLFYSRMPLKQIDDIPFFDALGKPYHKKCSNRMTSILPKDHVCLFDYKKTLSKAGFSRFLIDVSCHEADKQLADTLLQKLKLSESIPNTTTFNFERGMK